MFCSYLPSFCACCLVLGRLCTVGIHKTNVIVAVVCQAPHARKIERKASQRPEHLSCNVSGVGLAREQSDCHAAPYSESLNIDLGLYAVQLYHTSADLQTAGNNKGRRCSLCPHS